MAKRERGGALVACIVIVVSNLSADEFSNPGAIGRELPYEGVLDLDGAPAEGPYDFQFRIYDSATGSTVLWTSQASDHAGVEVEAGRFSVVFIGLPDPVFEAAKAHLAISVAKVGDSLQPLSGRQKLHSVPFAVRSAHALHADNAKIAERVTDQGRIGEIRYSLLSESEFQARYGTEWELLQGQTISGELATALGTSTLPNASGRYLRSVDFTGGVNPESKAVGDTQPDTFKDHTHSWSLFGVANYSTCCGGPGFHPTTTNYGQGSFNVATGGASTGSGSETRPKTLVVNVFVKVRE